MTIFNSWHWRRPRVRREVGNTVVIEHGSLRRLPTPERAAIIAQYSVERRLSRSFRVLVHQFATNGYLPVVVSGSLAGGELEWGGQLPEKAVVIRQPNLGYDFGSWSIALHLLPQLRQSPNVILANDSVLGPFTSIKGLLEQFERTEADVWGLTDTYQHFHHLQSYFIGYRGGVLDDQPLRSFWDRVRIEPSKWDIILHNELALAKLLRTEGYATTSAFRADRVVAYGDNPLIRGWWRLLALGFPFVKREIVRDPSVAPRSASVADEVRSRFGQVLDEWL